MSCLLERNKPVLNVVTMQNVLAQRKLPVHSWYFPISLLRSTLPLTGRLLILFRFVFLKQPISLSVPNDQAYVREGAFLLRFQVKSLPPF